MSPHFNMVIYTLRILWAKALCLSVISSVLSLWGLRSLRVKASSAECVNVSPDKTYSTTSDRFYGWRPAFFFFFVLWEVFVQWRLLFCPWLLNSPLSWCGCIKVLVMLSLCVDVSLKCSFFMTPIRKDSEVCWCQKWGSEWFFVHH